MAAYLLDSNILIDALTHRRNRHERLTGLVEQGHSLACCSINVTEVYSGMRPVEEASTDELLGGLEYYPVTWPIARSAGLLRRDYARKGRNLSLADCTIAAVVLAHDLTLITDNLKDYPMPQIRLHALDTDWPA